MFLFNKSLIESNLYRKLLILRYAHRKRFGNFSFSSHNSSKMLRESSLRSQDPEEMLASIWLKNESEK